MFIIDQILLQNGTMVFRADFLYGLETEISLPDTRITDIGAETNGALPAVIIEAITDLIITAVERASRRIDLKALAEKNEIPVPSVNISALLKKVRWFQMSIYRAPVDEMLLVMQEIGNLDQIAGLPGYEDATSDLVAAILAEASKLGTDVLDPINASGDVEGCVLGEWCCTHA